jgi:endoglycosylceramidase
MSQGRFLRSDWSRRAGAPRRFGVVLAFVSLLGCSSGGSSSEPLPRFVRDEQGRALIFHGVNVSSSAKGTADNHPVFTEADADRVALDWGFDFVRYLIFWSAVEPSKGAYDQAYLDGVEARLDWFAERGVHVLVDMHQDVYSAQFCCDGAPTWAIEDDGLPFELQSQWFANYFEPAVQAAFDNFWEHDGDHPELQDAYVEAWKVVAERLRDHPAVIGYDMMNEPNPGSRFDALEAVGLKPQPNSPSPGFDRDYLGPFYQRVIDGIREVDEDTWLFFEPRYGAPGNGSPSFLPALTDPRRGEDRLVYAPHLYSVRAEASGSYAESDDTVASWEANRALELETLRAPLVMGEWGFDLGTKDADRYMRDVLDMADRALASWAYWSYDLGSWGPVLGDGSDAWSVDLLTRPYPRAVAGTPVAFGFDPDTRVFTLEVARREGVTGATEVHVPKARLYPEGYAVEVSDAEGTWSSSWDDARQILSLTLDPSAATHTVTIRPAP